MDKIMNCSICGGKIKDKYEVLGIEPSRRNCIDAEMIRINSIIDDIPEDMRIAVWGIGRHASMLLANSKLGEKNIVAVYDSDKSKQNKKFNGINIQAFDESDVINHKIDAVIIATYAARRIIEKILDTYKQDIQIIDLYDNENLC